MSKCEQSDFNPGDLVRVEPLWPRKPEEYIGIVADAEPRGRRSSAVAGRIPVCDVNRPTRVNWVRPSRLELVQRGGQ